ncbi:MAG: SagB/ThcOx family dehydrogenase [Acidobacteria bacterium]|nr:SagB/ThcOx family dehydrogenase [Acidobacteriota bacterium]
MKVPSPAVTSNTPRALRLPKAAAVPGSKLKLPEPKASRDATLRLALERRRSVRDYSAEPITVQQVSQMLWAAQGITAPSGLRTAPSAGAVFPVKLYLVASRVDGIPPGFYSYDVEERSLTMLQEGDKQELLSKVCMDQQCVADSACALLLTAWYGRVRREFGGAAEKLVLLEAGHIGQNWHLQAAALGLGSISIGKWDTTAMKMLLPMPRDEEPVYLLLAGRP